MKRFTLKNMTTFISILLLFAFFMVACGSSADEPADSTDNVTETEAPTTESAATESETVSAETPKATADSAMEESEEPLATRSRLVVGIPFMDEILDAQQAFDGSAITLEQIGQALLRIDNATGELIPDLAESWSFSEDGKTMTFILPEGAVYANGDPLDAQAVGAALMRNKEVSPYASDFEALIDFNAVDATTLELNFSDPPAAFLTVLNGAFGGPWNAAEAEKVGNEAFAIAPVASGPLMVGEYTAGSELLLIRNDSYLTNLPQVENQGPLHLEEVLVRAIPEDVTLAGELEAGTVDMIVPAPVSAIDRLRDNPDITVWETVQRGFSGLVMNQNHPFLSDLVVRQAIATAIDRESLIKVVEGASPVHTFVTEGMVAYSPEAKTYGQELYPYDVAAAQALLVDAGWRDSDGDGIVEKEGEPFAVELLIAAGDVAQQQASQILQIQLKEVGIDLQINQQDGGAIWDTKVAGDFDIGFDGAGWGDPDILSLIFGAPFWNFGKYENPALMEEMSAARTILDIDERTTAYTAIQQTLLDDVAGIPLWQATRYVAVRNNVEGLVVDGFPIYLNDVIVTEP